MHFGEVNEASAVWLGQIEGISSKHVLFSNEILSFGEGCTIYSFSTDIAMHPLAIVTLRDMQCWVRQMNSNILFYLFYWLLELSRFSFSMTYLQDNSVYLPPCWLVLRDISLQQRSPPFVFSSTRTQSLLLMLRPTLFSRHRMPRAETSCSERKLQKYNSHNATQWHLFIRPSPPAERPHLSDSTRSVFCLDSCLFVVLFILVSIILMIVYLFKSYFNGWFAVVCLSLVSLQDAHFRV